MTMIQLYGVSGKPINLWQKLMVLCPSLRIDTYEATSPNQTAYGVKPQSPFIFLDTPRGFANNCLKSKLVDHLASDILVLIQPGDVPTAVEAMRLGAHHVLEIDGHTVETVSKQIVKWAAERRTDPNEEYLDATPLPPSFSLEFSSEGIDMSATLDEMERALLAKALEKSMGNKAQAARLLGLNRTTFVEKLKRIKNDQDS